MAFRTRDLLVKQRTQLINALRGHLAEHGLIAPQGPAHVKVLADALEAAGSRLETLVIELGRLYLEQIELLSGRIADLDKVLKREAAREEETARLMTMPGVGPLTAMAVQTFAPPMETFRRDATSQPGRGSSLSSDRPAASRSSDERPRWGSATYGVS